MLIGGEQGAGGLEQKKKSKAETTRGARRGEPGAKSKAEAVDVYPCIAALICELKSGPEFYIDLEFELNPWFQNFLPMFF